MRRAVVALPGMETQRTTLMCGRPISVSSAGTRAPSRGVTDSTDACYMRGRCGPPCVVYGPGSIDQLHTLDEWIDLDDDACAVGVDAEMVRPVGMSPAESM